MDGIFGNLFDLNRDGHMSVPEHVVDFAVFNHFVDEIDAEAAAESSSRRSDSVLDDLLFSDEESLSDGDDFGDGVDSYDDDFDSFDDDFDDRDGADSGFGIYDDAF